MLLEAHQGGVLKSFDGYIVFTLFDLIGWFKFV